MIKPNITYGRTNINDRINDYIKSFKYWNKIADEIPYKIYIYENSGFECTFKLNPKITYISKDIKAPNKFEKSSSLAYVINDFINILNLQDTDRIFVLTGKYALLEPIQPILQIVEENNFVISGLPPEYGGNHNTMWFAGIVKILKEFVVYCINNCYDSSNHFEIAMSDIIKKYNYYIYNKPIKVNTAFVGGTNITRDFI